MFRSNPDRCVRMLTPITSKEQTSDRPWGWSCPACPHLPPRGGEPDYASYRVDRVTWKTVALHIPHRCKACDYRKKRQQRMWRRVDRCFTVSTAQRSSTYRYPKLLTFALPSEVTDNYADRHDQLRLLNSRLPRARRLLANAGIRGGVYVLECTSRLVPLSAQPNTDNEGFTLSDVEQPVMTWKHHAHVHMVAIGPFMKKPRFLKFCELLEPLGLGRINYKAMSTERAARKKVANYISKYLVKEGLTCRTWGIMRCKS